MAKMINNSPIKRNFNITLNEDLELKKFLLDEIEPDPNNEMPVEDIERFANDEIKPVGKLITPITVREMPDGKYRLISGERRWRAFIYLHEQAPEDERWERIPGYIIEVEDDTEHAIAGILANYAQRNYSDYDKAMLAGKLIRLYQKKGISTPESVKIVAKTMDVSKDQVYRYNKVANAPEELQNAVKQNVIAMSAAAIIADADEATQNNLMDLINAGVKMTRDEIQSIIKHSREYELSSTTASRTEEKDIKETSSKVAPSPANDTPGHDESANTSDAKTSLPNSNDEKRNAPIENVVDIPKHHSKKDLQKMLFKHMNAVMKQTDELIKVVKLCRENNIVLDNESKDKLKEQKSELFAKLNF